MTDHVVVVDLGGTQLRVAVVDREGTLTRMRSVPTNADEGRDAVMARLENALERTIASIEGAAPLALGLSLAGPTDPVTGIMFNPPNLPGWDRFSPRAHIEKHLKLPVFSANDATLGALAEHRYGAGRDATNMLFITVSTGIGGGLIIDGRTYEGSRGFAGEIGHMVIDRSGPECACGSRGCLEAMASGPAVARMARERLAAGQPSSLPDRCGGDLDAIDAVMVSDAAYDGDELSLSVIDDAASSLGIGIVDLVTTLDPEVIVIGGGMSNSLDQLMPGISREIEARATVYIPDRTVRIVRSELGNNVSLLGAAAMAFDSLEA